MPSAGRKLLMAGRGGLNLTHSEALPDFMARYGHAAPALAAAIADFPPDGLRQWSEALGQPTFVGSSGRVFPRAFKASPLLRAWLRRLDATGVRLLMRHRWIGWNDHGHLGFRTPEGERAVEAGATVLALGGQLAEAGFRRRLGRDASLPRRGISALRPANCGFTVTWSAVFRDRFEGQPLKGAAFTCGKRVVRGEAMVTRAGIEGGAIYALSADLRRTPDEAGHASLRVALRPDLDRTDLIRRLSMPRGKQSFSNWLRKTMHLAPIGIGLLQEAATASTVPLASLSPAALADLINAVPIKIDGIAPIARAISTAGGIAFDELDAGFMIRRLPGIFAAGEMLDWEAPTGGYLLQASFATGAAAGRSALKWLRRTG